jgi:hypothetical protein
MSQDVKFTNMQNRLYSFIYGEHIDSIEQVQEIRDKLKTYKSFTVYAKLQCEAMLAHSADFKGISEEVQKELWEDIMDAQYGTGLLNMYNALKEDVEACIEENKSKGEFDEDEKEEDVLNMMRRKEIVQKVMKKRELS